MSTIDEILSDKGIIFSGGKSEEGRIQLFVYIDRELRSLDIDPMRLGISQSSAIYSLAYANGMLLAGGRGFPVTDLATGKEIMEVEPAKEVKGITSIGKEIYCFIVPDFDHPSPSRVVYNITANSEVAQIPCHRYSTEEYELLIDETYCSYNGDYTKEELRTMILPHDTPLFYRSTYNMAAASGMLYIGGPDIVSCNPQTGEIKKISQSLYGDDKIIIGDADTLISITGGGLCGDRQLPEEIRTQPDNQLRYLLNEENGSYQYAALEEDVLFLLTIKPTNDRNHPFCHRLYAASISSVRSQECLMDLSPKLLSELRLPTSQVVQIFEGYSGNAMAAAPKCVLENVLDRYG